MMGVTVYAFGTLDMHQTVKDGGTFQSEEDPLAKPLVVFLILRTMQLDMHS